MGAIGRTALGSPKTVTDPVDAVGSEFDTDFAILTASQPGETTLAVASFACSASGLVGLGCRSGYARRGARGMDGAVLSVRGTYRSNGGQSPEHHGVTVSWRARLAAQIEFWVAAGSLAPAGAMESTLVHARLRRRIRGNKKVPPPVEAGKWDSGSDGRRSRDLSIFSDPEEAFTQYIYRRHPSDQVFL